MLGLTLFSLMGLHSNARSKYIEGLPWWTFLIVVYVEDDAIVSVLLVD